MQAEACNSIKLDFFADDFKGFFEIESEFKQTAIIYKLVIIYKLYVSQQSFKLFLSPLSETDPGTVLPVT